MTHCVAAVLILAACGFAAPAHASAAQSPPAPQIEIKFVNQDWEPTSPAAERFGTDVQEPATTPIVDFRHTVNDHGARYTYTMVGKNPYVAHANPSTTITTFLKPIRFRFSNGRVWNPAMANSCDPAASAVTRTQQSPLFTRQVWRFGDTGVGKTQYVDAFQRAMFYEQTKPGGINPGYHVMLALTTLPTTTIDVPFGAWAESDVACGNGKLGAIEINWWDGYVRHTLLPTMVANGVTGNDFPLFLFGNVVMFVNSPSTCCVLGYHSAKGSGPTFQSYAVATYETSGMFGAKPDTATLSHEIAEWMADPSGTNPTPPWGHVGNVVGCQHNLEPGDPLSDVVKTTELFGHTYHVQELAFASWFFHQTPSPSVNGWYSNFGRFRLPARTCG